MFLSRSGDLRPATTEPFTHILKPAGTAGFEMLPVVEWFCLRLGAAVGFQLPSVALVPMLDPMPPALLVERFDIRQDDHDRRRFALEDFCSILDLPASAKHDGSIERMGRELRPLSADPVADLEILLKRALFAWLIVDGDMHLKNVALLKIAEPGRRGFTSVRFAPLYDAITTRVFPGLASDLMALPLNGTANKLRPRDFAQLARTIDLPAGRAADAVTGLAAAAAEQVGRIDLPPLLQEMERAV